MQEVQITTLMKKAENTIILEPGDKLFRYGLNDGYPNKWDCNIHSLEYYCEEYGDKNQIGALFFYDNETAALQVLSAAINNQKEKSNVIKSATITRTELVKEITLLDLESGIDRCTNMLSCLYELGIDVLIDDFYNYQKREKYSSIREPFFKLYSDNYKERMSSATIVDDFFLRLPPLLGQSLTDFKNGHVFKNLLTEHGFDGYVFMEEFSSNTYCLLSAEVLSEPKHRQVNIIDEIGQWLQ